MKKLPFIALHLALGMAVVGASCSTKDAETSADNNKSAETVVADTTDSIGFAPSTNIRYIDEEELLSEYNLAKDFKEASIRAMSKLEAAQQTRANDLQQLQSQIENKMRNNSYTSEAQYNADVASFQKKQQDAQSYLANLQRNTELEMQQQQAQLMDSIESYIKIYNQSKCYDAILLKSAGLYFNPALDITKDIIECLNARYNKK